AARTEVRCGPPGPPLPFLLSGMPWAFNAVVGPEGHPHAVLVRAVEPVLGAEIMAARRGIDASRVQLTNGPGKVCAALGLDASAYGVDLCGSELYLAEGTPRAPIGRSLRINVDYAGAWATTLLRVLARGDRTAD